MFRKVLRILKSRGISGLLSFFVSRMREMLGVKIDSFQNVEKLFFNKRGIEIGGPSQIFSRRGALPVYPIAGQLDNCNFGNITVWEGQIQKGQTFQFNRDKPAGQQYILDATEMSCIESCAYDFVLSSHVLEHSANPILALSEWIRILKNHGTLAIVLPHKDATFDHLRPVTKLDHLIADFNAGIKEDDLSHMSEILALHDLERDPEAGDFDALKARSQLNFENRCFHHHVFDTCLAISLIDYMGLQIKAVEVILPMHILIIAEKIGEDDLPDNSPFTTENALYHRSSPFFSDREIKVGR